MDSEWDTILHQRLITHHLIEEKMHGPPKARFTEPNSDTIARGAGQTDFRLWETEAYRDVGVRADLDDSWAEVALTSPDPAFRQAIFEGWAAAGVDARARYGTLNGSIATHALLRLEDAADFVSWREKVPGAIRVQKDWAFLAVETTVAAKRGQPIIPLSSLLPGSSRGDLIVWLNEMHRVATEPYDVISGPPRPASLPAVLRGYAYGVFAYFAKGQWSGSFARVLGGLMARAILEGAAMTDKSSPGFGPVSNLEHAERLIQLIAKRENATADDALHQLDHCHRLLAANGSDIRPAGWKALQDQLGLPARMAIRRVFHSGIDLERVEQLIDLYIFDTQTHTYIDRGAFHEGASYRFEIGDLKNRHSNEPVMIRNKPINPIALLQSSALRVDVSGEIMLPEQTPGEILRYSGIDGVVEDIDYPHESHLTFNSWRGFSIKPPPLVHPETMRKFRTALDYTLGLLTMDNDAQIKWIQQWLAWTVQHPGVKQQIAWVVIGGQGIGKSFFGDIFMHALFGSLAGLAPGRIFSENNAFTVAPFKNKLMVFIDEISIDSRSSIDECKRFIRQTRIGGEEKYLSAGEYMIYARMMMASNRMFFGMNGEDAADRALFHSLAWTARAKRLTELGFQNWARQFLPHFIEFNQMLQLRHFREALMRHFMDFETTLEEVQSNEHSSATEEGFRAETMSIPRQIAKEIIEGARVFDIWSIEKPFHHGILARRIQIVGKDLGFAKPVKFNSVVQEFIDAEVLEILPSGAYRFKYKRGSLVAEFSRAIGVQLRNRFPYQAPDHYGPNDCAEGDCPAWMGKSDRAFTP